MGIVSDRYHAPVLGLGIIAYADPVENSYIIQPYENSTSRISQLPATVPGVSTASSGVANTSVYAVGDSVVYVSVSSEIWGTSPLLVAVILGKVAVDSIGVLKDYVEQRGGPAEYFKTVNKTLDRAFDELTAFATGKFVNSRIPGDFIQEGKNTLLRLSSDVSELHAGNCAEILNGVDGNKISVAVTEDKATAARTSKEYVVNNSTLSVEKTYLTTVEKYDKKVPREPDQIKITGELAYGEVSATLNGDSKPIAVVEKRSDGCEIHRAVAGAVFEQTSGLKIYYPTYKENLIYDGDLEEAPKGTRDAFDRVEGSSYWKEAKLEDQDEYVRVPGDLDKAPTLYTTDSENREVVPTHVGKATFGFLPSGGFLIRDAWGSEIRMENGDIQLSAARNLIRIAGEDSLGICSGVLSETAESGVQVGATNGNIDLYSGKDTNLHSNEEFTITSDASIYVLGTEEVLVGSEHSAVLLQGTDCVMEADDSITISAEHSRVFGESEAMLASANAAVRCRGDLTLAGKTIDVRGDMSISKSKFEPGKISDVLISVPGGSGSLQVEGQLYVKGMIRGDSQVQAFQEIVGSRVIAQNVAPEVGVYKTTTPLRQLNKLFSGPESSTTALDSAVSSLSEDGLKETVKSLLSSMFGLINTELRIVKPRFSGDTENESSIGNAPSIVTDSGTRYIYPGESFWERNGCITLTAARSADTIRDERSGGTEESGVVTMQLHQRKEVKNG